MRHLPDQPDCHGLLMLLAAIYYAVFLARREDWKLHGPAEIID